MLIAVLCDDKYHPAEVILQGMSALQATEAGLEITTDFFTESDQWSFDQAERYPVILLSKGNARSAVDLNSWLTEEVQAGFTRYVENGGGLLVVHSGAVGYGDQPRFRHLVGGGFRHHPAPGPVLVEATQKAALLDLSVAPFTVHDEHYLMDVYNDDLSVFLTSTSPAGTEPAGWTRTQGSGRVCVVTPGHYVDVWLHPGYQEILQRAIAWCANRDHTS